MRVCMCAALSRHLLCIARLTRAVRTVALCTAGPVTPKHVRAMRERAEQRRLRREELKAKREAAQRKVAPPCGVMLDSHVGLALTDVGACVGGGRRRTTA